MDKGLVARFMYHAGVWSTCYFVFTTVLPGDVTRYVASDKK